MEVAREVQVNLVHRQNLRIASASGTALQSEHRAERRFAQYDDGTLTYLAQSEVQADADGRLADAGLRRTDARHENQVALLGLLFVDERKRKLGHVVTIAGNLLGIDAELFGYAFDAQ